MSANFEIRTDPEAFEDMGLVQNPHGGACIRFDARGEAFVQRAAPVASVFVVPHNPISIGSTDLAPSLGERASTTNYLSGNVTPIRVPRRRTSKLANERVAAAAAKMVTGAAPSCSMMTTRASTKNAARGSEKITPQDRILSFCSEFENCVNKPASLCKKLGEVAKFVTDEMKAYLVNKQHREILVCLIECFIHAAPSNFRISVLEGIEKAARRKNLSKAHQLRISAAIEFFRKRHNAAWRSLLQNKDIPTRKDFFTMSCLHTCVLAAVNLAKAYPQMAQIFCRPALRIPLLFGKDQVLFLQAVCLSAEMLRCCDKPFDSQVPAYKKELLKLVDPKCLQVIVDDTELLNGLPNFWNRVLCRILPKNSQKTGPKRAPKRRTTDTEESAAKRPCIKNCRVVLRRLASLEPVQIVVTVEIELTDTIATVEADCDEPAKKSRKSSNGNSEPTSNCSRPLKHKSAMKSLPSLSSQSEASTQESVNSADVEPEGHMQAEEVMEEEQSAGVQPELMQLDAVQQPAELPRPPKPLPAKKVQQKRVKGAAPTRTSPRTSSSRKASQEAKAMIKYCCKARNSNLEEARKMIKDNTLEDWLRERSKTTKSKKPGAGLSKSLKAKRKP